ncbi:hypothetical protein ACSBR2_021013 [Camellia fascicularis]
MTISFSPKVEDDSGFTSESYDLQVVGTNQVYGNSSNGSRSDDGEAKLFPHMNQVIVSGLDQGQEDLLIQSDERKQRKRGRKPANGREELNQPFYVEECGSREAEAREA